jgi:hypothetical protein
VSYVIVDSLLSFGVSVSLTKILSRCFGRNRRLFPVFKKALSLSNDMLLSGLAVSGPSCIRAYAGDGVELKLRIGSITVESFHVFLIFAILNFVSQLTSYNKQLQNE